MEPESGRQRELLEFMKEKIFIYLLGITCILMIFFPLTAFSIIGETPILDTKGLKISGIKTRDQLKEVEDANIHEAFLKYFNERKDPLEWFNEEELKTIHHALFGDVWEWAGSYYSGPHRSIGVPSSKISSKMKKLIHKVHGWLQGTGSLTELKKSARIAHYLLRIHPFTNGNGRFARFVSNLYLFSMKRKLINWPEDELQKEGPIRIEFYLAVTQADKKNFEFLYDLFKTYQNRD